MRQFSHSVENAKTMWCPFARYVDFGGREGVIGLNGAPGNGPQCVAGACMAWRWVETRITDPANPKNDLIPSGDTHGFCGLAGQP